MATRDQTMRLTRRAWLLLACGGVATLAAGGPALAQVARMPFRQWVVSFRRRAIARGIQGDLYDRVMDAVKPDTEVYELNRSQPEFTEEIWQYLNRRVSEWRIVTGQERARENAALLARIERDYGIDRFMMLGLWGMESAFGEATTNPKYMRPVIPALAALAWGEPRRRRYWEQELLNALTIVQRGWAKPQELVGSWAGAMGHTQWMPEVWLNIGVDYDRDGRIFPFGTPEDAFGGSARYLVARGRYRRGEAWGCEVALAANQERLADRKTVRSYAQWQALGIRRADGKPFEHAGHQVRLWQPVSGGPAFLIGQNFFAARSYNPSYNYALALVHLGDRIRGDGPFVRQFPGGERALTTAELQEIQQRLTARGFDTQGVDGRVGPDTMRAVRNFQLKTGLQPADGYPGLKVLARLRQGT
jgi:lytic murein transglycosylase